MPRLLIAGNTGGTNVGDSFAYAAMELGCKVQLVDTLRAFHGPRVWRAVSWRLLGRRPPALRAYNREFVAAVAQFRPDLVLTTGISPVSADALAFASRGGAAIVNFSTDDPWNPGQLSKRFLGSLPEYDVVFTPRHANELDFVAAGCLHVEYLPFGYDPRHAYPTPAESYGADVLFVGGGDTDRYAFLRPLLASGLRVVIHGGYWDADPLARVACQGQVGPNVLRRATATAKVNLCLVRRANRDGHVMRSYEIPAVGGCVLAEDTPDHRAIFGDSAVFFNDPAELAARAAELVADPVRRAMLAAAAAARVVGGGNTYRDRLATMLAAIRRRETG